MLKILHAGLQHYVNQKLPDVQAAFRKGRGTRDQIVNIHWIIEEAREFQKNICITDYSKAIDCVDHDKPWEALAAAASVKSLQSCLTLCNPIGGSPLGSSVPGILQARINGVGCHFFLQCMKVKSESEVAQSCLTLRDTMDCSLPGSSIHGIFQARVLEWVAIAFSDGKLLKRW